MAPSPMPASHSKHYRALGSTKHGHTTWFCPACPGMLTPLLLPARARSTNQTRVKSPCGRSGSPTKSEPPHGPHQPSSSQPWVLHVPSGQQQEGPPTMWHLRPHPGARSSEVSGTGRTATKRLANMSPAGALGARSRAERQAGDPRGSSNSPPPSLLQGHSWNSLHGEGTASDGLWTHHPSRPTPCLFSNLHLCIRSLPP